LPDQQIPKKSLLIFSIDVDVGSKQLGLINAGNNDRNVHNFVSECKVGQVEEEALPCLFNLLINILFLQRCNAWSTC
jgi:hypothetical protein